MTLWMVRSGKYGESEALALDSNLSIIGWEDMPDLTTFPNRSDLATGLATVYPDEKGKTISNWESQLWPFVHGMKLQDIVVMPLKHRASISIGRVAGPYQFRTDLGAARHTRPVQWQKEVPRTVFAQDLLYSFGSFMTVCRVQRNNAEERVVAVLQGQKDPAAASGGTPSDIFARADAAKPDPSTEEAARPVDLAEIADDGIRSRIATVFKGHKLSTLIGAILETQGYKVVVSPPGADGGVDIIAGKGALGFDPPRLVVQVKSQDSGVDVGVLRELQGVMKQFGAEQGLLVAWGGVTKALAKEAQRLFFEIRIWDSGEVVRAVQHSYDHFSEDVQADLPLKRIWALADQT
jgi:restriction system protein